MLNGPEPGVQLEGGLPMGPGRIAVAVARDCERLRVSGTKYALRPRDSEYEKSVVYSPVASDNASDSSSSNVEGKECDSRIADANEPDP